MKKKQSQTLETEKNEMQSHLDKQRKRSEQLETEKKELHFQLEEERTKLQQVSGNLQCIEITINLFFHTCSIINYQVRVKC